MKFFIKSVFVAVLLLAGLGALLKGWGVEVPVIKFKGFEASGVPAGLVLLAAGIALAKFWPVKTTTVKTTKTSPSGETTVTETRIDKGIR
jgi:hypothetical protein